MCITVVMYVSPITEVRAAAAEGEWTRGVKPGRRRRDVVLHGGGSRSMKFVLSAQRLDVDV